MSSISGITAVSYAASNYQTEAPKAPTTSTPAPAPSAAAEDSIHLSPEGHAAMNNPVQQKPTHAQLVMEANAGNPTAKAKLKLLRSES